MSQIEKMQEQSTRPAPSIEVESYEDLVACLQDLVEPLREAMSGSIRDATEAIRLSHSAAVRAFRGGAILHEARERAKAYGRPLVEVYAWAEDPKVGLSYSGYQVSVALNVFICFKTEDAVEGLSVEDCKAICGMSTKKDRKPKTPPAEPGSDRKGSKHREPRVPTIVEDGDGGDGDGGLIDAEKTTVLLYKLADLIEGVAAVRDEDFAALIRIAEKVRELQLSARVEGSANNQEEVAVNPEEAANNQEEAAVDQEEAAVDQEEAAR
jgi:hypothetical protein